MVPALRVKGNVAAVSAADRIDAAAVMEPSNRRSADDPTEARVAAGGRVRVKKGNVMKTNKKRIRRCKNAGF